MKTSKSKAGTKLIRITLSAFTRMEYTQVIEVPANANDDELDALVEQRYGEVDGGDFQDDIDYWERGSQTWEPADPGDEAEARATRKRGQFVVTEIKEGS